MLISCSIIHQFHTKVKTRIYHFTLCSITHDTVQQFYSVFLFFFVLVGVKITFMYIYLYLCNVCYVPYVYDIKKLFIAFYNTNSSYLMWINLGVFLFVTLNSTQTFIRILNLCIKIYNFSPNTLSMSKRIHCLSNNNQKYGLLV